MVSNSIIFSTAAESIGVSRSANDTGQWLQLGATKSGTTIKFYINADLIGTNTMDSYNNE